MATRIGPVATCMPLASPDEGSGMPVPPLDGVSKPIFEDLHIIDMVSLQGPSDNDPLYGFSHIEPRASTGRVQKPNAAFMAPTDQSATVMARQIIQNEQHAQGRVHPIQLLGGWKRVPILPPAPVWNLFWRGWTLLENGGKFVLEPGMQNGIRTLIDWFRSQFTSGRSKQRQHFAGLATNILVILACWDPLRLK